MLEPPSDQLQKYLAEFKLCTKGDLRRCRQRVRRLAHDLPAFDSVWIDALIQARRLTSFQASVFESGHPERLRVGPCLLVDKLGQGAAASTYLARRIDGNELCVVKRITVPVEEIEAVSGALTRLVSEGKSIAHPSLAVPHVFKRMTQKPSSRQTLGLVNCCDTADVILISRLVPGVPVSELLVRRGRFPAAVVQELGRQLLDALSVLEDVGLVHGDILLRNVRLTSTGLGALVDAGVRPCVKPELTIHGGVPPERCDGVAPELIGTGQHPTVASDLYSLGCLLWQLLAGRPPFPSCDSLAKLAAHQTQTVPDIRDWSPDTPAALAEQIRELTTPDAAQRPQSVREALERWGRPRRLGQRRVRKFRALFDTDVPRVPSAAVGGGPNRWTLLVAAIFALSGAVLGFVDQGARTHVLNLATRVSQSIAGTGRQTDETQSSTDTLPSKELTEDQSGLEPFPGPNVEGVILLTSNGPYATAEIAMAGAVTIRGADGLKPQVTITDSPMRIWAEQVTIENVEFTSCPDETVASQDVAVQPLVPSAALLLVQADTLALEHCRFQTHRIDRSRSDSVTEESVRPVAIAWKPLESGAASRWNVSVRNTVFVGMSPAVHLAAAPQRVAVMNCLKLCRGSFFDLIGPALTGRNLHFSLKQTTLRESGPLLRLLWPASKDSSRQTLRPDSATYRIEIDANDCVFHLAGTRGALFESLGHTASGEWLESIEMRGLGSLMRPECPVAAAIDIETGQRTRLESHRMVLEGLMAAPFEFSGVLGNTAQDSAVLSCDAPRQSASLPGIDATRLP